MTLECARCHDHKFDPIRQKDYYNLFAFFNNIDEWGMYNDSHHVPTPSLLLPDSGQQQAIDAARGELDTAVKALREYESAFAGKGPVIAEGDAVLQIRPSAAFDFDCIDEKQRIPNQIRADQPGEPLGGNELASGKRGMGIRFSGDDAASFPSIETGLNPWERFAVSMWVWIPQGRSEAVLLHHTSGTDVGFFGTALELVDGRLRFSMTRFWPGNALAIESNSPPATDRWTHLVIANEADGTAAGLQLYVDGVRDNHILRDNLGKRPDAGGSGFSLGARFRSPGFENGMIDDLQVFDRPLSSAEVRMLYRQVGSLPVAELSPAELSDYARHNDDAFNALAANCAAACKKHLDSQTDILEIPVMREWDEVRPAWTLARGNYDAPRSNDNLARRETPSALPPLPAKVPRDRLGLAQWLTAPDHPLTARVAVNRLWANFFGNGLVASMNDFGVQGARPTHPELLDWLARDFVASGWDVKRFCRQVVLSRSYRQDSAATAAAWQDDPHNELLARGPSRRLTAEMIRDTALLVSGLLNGETGGPPVSPYQPQNLWREDNTMTPEYHQSAGTALYRRSLYTVWKRTAPIPNMLLFDAAGREVCTMRRTPTNTPLQALVLLNDPQFVEAARVMAEICDNGGAEDEVRASISGMFLGCTSRLPDARERDLLGALYVEQLAWFAENPDEAGKWLAIGEHPLNDSIPKPQLAALAVVAQAILACDATIWRR
jgi:hypothetical protein